MKMIPDLRKLELLVSNMEQMNHKVSSTMDDLKLTLAVIREAAEIHKAAAEAMLEHYQQDFTT